MSCFAQRDNSLAYEREQFYKQRLDVLPKYSRKWYIAASLYHHWKDERTMTEGALERDSYKFKERL